LTKAFNLKREAIITYIRIFVTVIFGFVTVPLIINTIGKTGFGVLSIVLTVTSYSLLLQLGLGNTIVRYVAKYSSSDKIIKYQIVSLAVVFYTIVSILALFGAIFLYFNMDVFKLAPEQVVTAKNLFIIYSLDAVITIPFTAFYSYMKGNNRFSVFNMTQISRTVLRFFLILVLFNLGKGIYALAFVDVCLNQSINIFNFMYSKKRLDLKFCFKFKDKKMISEIAIYSIFIFLTQLVDYFYWKIDNILLGLMTTVETVAEYNTGQIIIQNFMQFATAVSGITLPTLSILTNHADSEVKIRAFLDKTSRIQMLIISPLVAGFWLFGKQFICVWLKGHDFANSYLFALVIIVPLGIVLIQSTAVNMLAALNKHKYRLYILLGSAILNLFISIFLIKSMGAIGASLGTGIMLVVGDFILVNIVYYKVIGFNVLVFLKNNLPSMVLCLSPAVIMGAYIRNISISDVLIIDLFLKCMIFAVMYGAVVYFLYSKNDKSIVIERMQ
jgi:O-antigen/teichoic acid export membrane protein